MTTTETTTLRESQEAAGAADAPSMSVEANAAHHDEHLAHHFHSSGQQFSAAKLGMWMFLATEVLFFAGLFCYYTIQRANHPEIFAYGAQFLDTNLGAINTVVLILSSLTMAAGVTFAQRGQKWPLVTALSLTLLGGLAFMGIKYVEYSHKIEHNYVWGLAFYEPHEEAHGEGAVETDPVEQPEAALAGDPDLGKQIWTATCRSCHGVAGEGIEGQGKDIRGSEFIASQSDKELMAFIKQGRMPFDPANTTGLQMPPKGGNPMLNDEDLTHIVAYIRTFEVPSETAVAEGGEPGAEGQDVAAAAAEEEEFFIPKSSVPPASSGPAGLVAAQLGSVPEMAEAEHRELDPATDPNRPENAHLFFNAYFMMTGLHGIHVLVGLGVIGWLIVGALRGRYGPKYFTPVDVSGLYWHLVDLVWIFLFPLLYLI